MASAETSSEPFRFMDQGGSRWLQLRREPSPNGTAEQRATSIERQLGSPIIQPCRQGVASAGRVWGFTIKATDAIT